MKDELYEEMQDELDNDEWIKILSDSERRKLMAIVKKRFFIFLLISIIPVVNFVTMGMAIFCYNEWSWLRSRGRNTGSNLLRFVLMCWAYIIPPIIVVTLCSKIESLGSKIVGF